MASSATDIANLALGHLGEARITALDADNASARACSLHYAQTRDAFLRSHRWNFATQRVELSELADAPAFGWGHQFGLPSNFLRMLELNDTEFGDIVSDEFVIETYEDGKRLLTDSDIAQIVYIWRNEDVSTYDPIAVDSFSVLLALKLSETIRGTTGKTAELQAQYERITAPLARRLDANEGRRRKGLISLNSMFIRARSGY